MTKLTLYLATQNLPFEGSSLKVKQGNTVLGTTEVRRGRGATYKTTFQIEHVDDGKTETIWIDVRDGSGSVKCTRSFYVEDILTSNEHRVKARKLSTGRGILAAHLTSSMVTGNLRLKLSGRGLKNVDGLFDRSDPLFYLMTPGEGGTAWVPLYRSETVHKDLNPKWKELSIGLAELCGGSLYRPMRIAVFDEDQKMRLDVRKRMSIVKSRQENCMGCIGISVAGLLRKGSMPLLYGGEDYGRIVVEEAELVGYSDPREYAVKAMDAAGQSEIARLEVADSEARLRRAEEALKEAEARIKEAAKDIATKRLALAEALAAWDVLDVPQ